MKGSCKVEIKTFKLSELVPYENNPRDNSEAVEYVANSIKEFGFKVPALRQMMWMSKIK